MQTYIRDTYAAESQEQANMIMHLFMHDTMHGYQDYVEEYPMSPTADTEKEKGGTYDPRAAFNQERLSGSDYQINRNQSYSHELKRGRKPSKSIESPRDA